MPKKCSIKKSKTSKRKSPQKCKTTSRRKSPQKCKTTSRRKSPQKRKSCRHKRSPSRHGRYYAPSPFQGLGKSDALSSPNAHWVRSFKTSEGTRVPAHASANKGFGIVQEPNMCYGRLRTDCANENCQWTKRYDSKLGHLVAGHCGMRKNTTGGLRIQPADQLMPRYESSSGVIPLVPRYTPPLLPSTDSLKTNLLRLDKNLRREQLRRLFSEKNTEAEINNLWNDLYDSEYDDDIRDAQRARLHETGILKAQRARLREMFGPKRGADEKQQQQHQSQPLSITWPEKQPFIEEIEE